MIESRKDRSDTTQKHAAVSALCTVRLSRQVVRSGGGRVDGKRVRGEKGEKIPLVVKA